MRSRAGDTLRRSLRWLLLVVAVVVLVVFLAVQQQSAEVSYGESPTRTADREAAGGPGGATLPSAAEMTALVAAEKVVRLPGAIAHWDTGRVRAAIGDNDLRILVAPPGLDEEQREQVRAVENADVRIYGTDVTGGIYRSVPDTIPGWRAQLATGDVTDQLAHLVTALTEGSGHSDVDTLRWREPSRAEVETVAADLRTAGWHAAAGATLTGVPATGAGAFPDAGALYVALPRQAYGRPLPRYGPALAELFPDRPIVVLYGSWVEYHGPGATEFADLAATNLYAHLGERLSRYEYGQDQVLGAYLARVTDLRYAGLFDRPLPYTPFDPLRVTLPALPWIFAGCVVAFLVLSARSLRRPVRTASSASGPRSSGSARLTALTAVAFELSGLTGRQGDPALARGIVMLEAARQALAEAAPPRQVRRLLDRAADELDEAARDFPGYRPGALHREDPS